MFRFTATILSLCFAGAIAQAQDSAVKIQPAKQAQDSTPVTQPAKAGPYANLPPRDKFNKGELEESFNILIDQIKITFSDTKSVLEADYLQFYHFNHRLTYFAKHPYINDAVKIKTSWMLKLAEVMGAYYQTARRYEVARNAEDEGFIKKWEAELAAKRAAALELTKKPEKLDKKHE